MPQSKMVAAWKTDRYVGLQVALLNTRGLLVHRLSTNARSSLWASNLPPPFPPTISTGSMVQNHGHYRRKRPSRGKLRGTCSSIAAAAMSRRDRAACHQPEREKGLEEAQYARYLPASSTRHRHCRPAATHLRFEMSGAVVPHY